LETQGQENVPQPLDGLRAEELTREIQGKARPIAAELMDQAGAVEARH
jgi:hypothetical protein